MDRALREKLIKVAAGREKADILIHNAKVVDVFCGNIFHDSISIVDGHFAGFANCEANEIIDAKGKYMLPGLIDAHVHIESSMLTPDNFANIVMPHGTTTVIADPHEIVNVAGRKALDYMLKLAENIPLDLRIMLPSCVPAVPFEENGAVITAKDIADYIAHPLVTGLGEVMDFPAVISCDKEMLDKLHVTSSAHKVIDGHAPCLSGRELDAYIAAGIITDHECTSVAELHDRLRRGMYVHLRHGSAVRNLVTLLSGVTKINMRRCLLCTDDAHPDTLINEGHMDRHLRLAVKCGLNPILAIIMATLNVAECYGLNKGAIAPGREADFIFVEDFKDFAVQDVFIHGRKVVANGHLLETKQVKPPEFLLHTVCPAPLPDDVFQLAVPQGQARVIGLMPNSLISKALKLTVQIDAQGYFDPQLNQGLNLLAVIERHRGTGNIGIGIVSGYALHGGAIATTVAHDSHNILLIGDNSADMHLAVSCLISHGGGFVICRNGKEVGSLPLPIGGLMTTDTVENIQKALVEMIKLAHEMGVPLDIEPFMSLSFLALPVIPELKLTTKGLFDVQSFDFVPTAVD